MLPKVILIMKNFFICPDTILFIFLTIIKKDLKKERFFLFPLSLLDLIYLIKLKTHPIPIRKKTKSKESFYDKNGKQVKECD